MKLLKRCSTNTVWSWQHDAIFSLTSSVFGHIYYLTNLP